MERNIEDKYGQMGGKDPGEPARPLQRGDKLALTIPGVGLGSQDTPLQPDSCAGAFTCIVHIEEVDFRNNRVICKKGDSAVPAYEIPLGHIVRGRVGSTRITLIKVDKE